MTEKQQEKLARNRELIEAGEYMSAKELSERFGLSVELIDGILKGERRASRATSAFFKLISEGVTFEQIPVSIQQMPSEFCTEDGARERYWLLIRGGRLVFSVNRPFARYICGNKTENVGNVPFIEN